MSDPDDYKGYREPLLSVMKAHGVTVWSTVLAKTSRGIFEGLVLPRSETSDAEHLSLKLVSGYNLGLRHEFLFVVRSICRSGLRTVGGDANVLGDTEI